MKAVIVHGPGHVAAAIAPGLPVVLLSAGGAGGYGGVLWWQALVARAILRPGVTDILDCGDAPGHVMAALREGQRHIICPPGPAFPALRAAAAEMGATLLTERPDALDLARPGAARLIERWLRGTDPPG